jgi:hypothetical protein
MPLEMQSFFVLSVGLTSLLLGYWFIPILYVINVIPLADSQVEQASQFAIETSSFQGFINE